MSAWIIAVVFAAVAFVLGFLLHHLYRQMELKKKVGLKKDEAEIIIENARKEAEKVRIQGELKAKEIVEKRTAEIEFEVREKQKELFKAEKRLQKREEVLDKKYEAVEKRESDATRKERDLVTKDEALSNKQKELDSV
ncbi:MAG: DUF3552 domain-containing protein, partial [Candidatus Dadabacteria bacterium]|nr:DUF3552 domain-containing protein [Candidatus Dadabacteria bacterium]